MAHPCLVGFARAMAEESVATARFNFHYANSGRRSPDPEPSLRAAWVGAFEGVRAMAGGLPMLAGGKSLGGGLPPFRVRGVKAEDREIGASLAAVAAPFVRRVAGAG